MIAEIGFGMLVTVAVLKWNSIKKVLSKFKPKREYYQLNTKGELRRIE